MQIFIKTNFGTLIIEAEPSDTIENIKFKIEERACHDPGLQNLTFAGKLLEDEKTLADL